MNAPLIQTPDYSGVLSRLQKVRPHAHKENCWHALCPAHPDRSPSLSLWVGRNGALIIRCWTGKCSLGAIMDVLGLCWNDLFPPDDRRKLVWADPPRVVATYDYFDELGELLHQTVRYDPKRFVQRRPDGNGGWINSLEGVRTVLYKLPGLLGSTASEQVNIVAEGEKDVDKLDGLGFIATTNPGGCGMGWKDEYSRFLAGRDVCILPDNDSPGRKRACQVAGSLLLAGAKSLRVVDLPGLHHGGDVSDFLKKHGDQGKEKLWQEINKTKPWTRAK